MSNNDKRAKMFYCKENCNQNTSIEDRDPNTRLIPAPQLSISPEIYYINDSVIGYTYNITLKGYADTRKSDGTFSTGISHILTNIDYIRKIFNTNGGTLFLYDNADNKILQAKGATIKSIKFDESDNKWNNFAPYSIEIEFNEVDFLGCKNNSIVGCDTSLFNNDQPRPILSENLLNLQKYKVKSFNDKWTFNIENDIYSQNIFKVTYNISATGKNYYSFNDDDVKSTLIPAWVQAKNFIQDRLYNQITSLVDNIGTISSENNDGCAATLSINDLYKTANSLSIFKEFDKKITSPITYLIFNENIDCETSESDGSFSVTYNATIKGIDPSIDDSNSSAIHTFTINQTTSDNGNEYTTSISVQGNVQGLIKGSIANNGKNDFELPKNGQFILKKDPNITKYNNAYNSYKYYIGNDSDLNEEFKNNNNITKSNLLIKDPIGSARPSSFVLEHNYHEGTVSYTAQYDSKLNMSLTYGYTNISIVKNDPTPIVNEFVIPGRRSGPIIQKLGCYTPKTMSISIEGANYENKHCSIQDLCSYFPNIGQIYTDLASLDPTVWIKTGENYSQNQIDGSFSLSIEYTCTSDIY